LLSVVFSQHNSTYCGLVILEQLTVKGALDLCCFTKPSHRHLNQSQPNVIM